MNPQSFNTLDKMQEDNTFQKTVRQSMEGIHAAQTGLKMPVLNADEYGISARQGEEPQFLLAINGEQVGPYTKDQIGAMIRQGQISVDTLLWRSGMLEWMPIKNVPGLI
jgi:hypothetical protein